MPALMMVRLAPERTVCWSRRYARTSSRRIRMMKSSVMRLLCRLIGTLATRRRRVSLDPTRSAKQSRSALGRGESGSVQFVVHIPLPRFPARLADAPLDLFERQVMHGARRGDHVLLDHQAAHVVG